MDVALLNLLEDRSPTPSPAAGAARRLRDLWLAGMPLERAAAAAGLTVSEAEDRLTALGYALPPKPIPSKSRRCGACMWTSACRRRRWRPGWG